MKFLPLIKLNGFLIILSSFAGNAQIEERPPEEGDLFLPSEIFKYQDKDARSVWLGLTTLPKEMQAMVQDLQGEIGKILRGGSYETPDRLHITLKYLGKISPSPLSIDTLIRGLKNVLIFPMKIKPEKLHILKNQDGSPRLIVLTLASPNLKLFKLSVENALDGFAGRDTREYWPHITLYTFGKPKVPGTPLPEQLAKKIEEDITIPDATFRINGFELAETGRGRGALHIVHKAFMEAGLPVKPETIPAVPVESPVAGVPLKPETIPTVPVENPNGDDLKKYSMVDDINDYVSNYNPLFVIVTT
jgi:2'-5' RNA ligase